MNTKKLIQKIEKHFFCHGVALALILLEVVGVCERFIFKLKLKPGTKENLIFDRARDIQTALQLPLFQVFKEGLSICLAVSGRPVAENSLWKMLTSLAFMTSKMWLPIALGYDMRGGMRFADLGKMPHAMYAGSTRSGKSVGLQCLILSLIIKQAVSKVNLLLFDVGANTMELFAKVPHLSCPIVKDPETGIGAMLSLVDEMERRIGLDYDELRNLPAIVCIVDEYVSLISNIGDKKTSLKLANAVSNLLRRGRHAKIHMVLATQGPTIKNMKVDVGNITARMAYACAKYHNSIAILGESGAEKLPGKGAMLFKSGDYPEPIPLQGAYMFSDDIKQLVTRIASAPHNLSNKFVIPETDALQLPHMTGLLAEMSPRSNSEHKKLSDIILWALGRENISANQIQQYFKMGNRAAGLVDRLFQMDIIADKFANQPRVVLPSSVEDVPDEVLAFLSANGIAAEDIAAAIAER
jgi:DNA segregation ATPase FtsK/SpoIIIE-like protein